MAMPGLYDRVKETTTTTGTGTVNLAGAATGFRTFVAAVGTGNTCYYCIALDSEWEVGIGTVTDAAPDTLSRDKILASSNAGAAVNFSAGTKDVWLNAPASILTPVPVPGGRLTLESGVPVSTADQTGKTTIYYTPHIHDVAPIPNASSLELRQFAELSLALGTLTSGANYDVFLYDAAGTLTLKLGPAWTSNTARGTGAGTTELERWQGVWVNKINIASGPDARKGLYLGTLRTTSTTATEDSGGGTATQVGGKRFVWNAYNRVVRHLAVYDATTSWTTTSDWRQANAAAGNQVEFVLGLQLDAVVAVLIAGTNQGTTANFGYNGIGVDSTTTASGNRTRFGNASASTQDTASPASWNGYPGLGYHYLAWLEKSGSGTITFYGEGGTGGGYRSGLTAEVLG